MKKQSTCPLELDAWPLDILNRSRVRERPREALINLTRDARLLNLSKLVPSLETIWASRLIKYLQC